MKRFIFIIFLIIFLIIIPFKILHAQDVGIEEVITSIIDDFDSGKLEQQDPEIQKLLEELKELSAIPKPDRTIEQWDRIIQILISLAFMGIDNAQAIIDSLALEIARMKRLNEEQEKSIEELESLKKLYQDLIDLVNADREMLIAIKEAYEKRLKEIERTEPKINSLGIGIDIGTINYGEFSFTVYYTHDITNNFGLIFGIEWEDVFQMYSKKLGISLNLGFVFKFNFKN